MLNGHTSIALRFSAGQPLPLILPEMKRVRELAISYKQDGILPMMTAKYQQVLNLVGDAENVLVLTGEVMDEEVAIEHAKRSESWLLPFAIHIWKCEIAFFLGDYEQVRLFAETAIRLKKIPFEDFWSYTIRFYDTIACLVLAQDHPSSQKELRVAVRRNQKVLRKLVQGAPVNFAHLNVLVRAEMACLRGQKAKALKLYEESIKQASEGCFLHHHAVAYERKALTLHRLGEQGAAHAALEKARSLYEEWGATFKLQQIDSMKFV